MLSDWLVQWLKRKLASSTCQFKPVETFHLLDLCQILLIMKVIVGHGIKLGCSLAEVLTVICENVPADALIDHMAFRQSFIPLPLSSAGTVLRDQTGYGSLI